MPLKKVLGLWNLDGQRAAEGFGATTEQLEDWIKHGVPSEMVEPLSDLSAATDILLHYLNADRIPAVVRRPSRVIGGKSLVDLYGERDMAGILDACRSMFRFEAMHG